MLTWTDKLLLLVLFDGPYDEIVSPETRVQFDPSSCLVDGPLGAAAGVQVFVFLALGFPGGGDIFCLTMGS